MAKVPKIPFKEYLRILVDVASSTDILHQPLPLVNGKPNEELYGLTEWGEKRRIYINTDCNSGERAKLTLLHEALHIYALEHNIKLSESDVIKFSEEIYSRLYETPVRPLKR